jgi:(2Fe-2S) ferredoxin
MSHNCVLICQHLTCRKQGAAKILATFRSMDISSKFSYEGSGCLGRCGNGPNILIMPAQIWYHSVLEENVSAIIAKLRDNEQ